MAIGAFHFSVLRLNFFVFIEVSPQGKFRVTSVNDSNGCKHLDIRIFLF